MFDHAVIRVSSRSNEGRSVCSSKQRFPVIMRGGPSPCFPTFNSRPHHRNIAIQKRGCNRTDLQFMQKLTSCLKPFVESKTFLFGRNLPAPTRFATPRCLGFRKMLKWMSGKLLVYNFRRDLQFARYNCCNRQARKLCSFLLRHIFAVKAAGRLGRENELDVTTEALASFRRQPSSWLQRIQPETVADALLDHWLSAKSAVLSNLLDEKIFQTIDDELWVFAKSVLKPKEIEDLHAEALISANLTTRRRAVLDIEDLIVEYAAMGEPAYDPMARSGKLARG
jgi:hypothetical protein